MSAAAVKVETEVEIVKADEKRLSRGRLVWRRFLRNKTAVVGALGILFLVFLAIFGSSVLYWKFDDIDTQSFLAPPSESHILGATRAGRDVLALTVRGLGKSLLIGFVVALMSTTIAALVGASAAYLGGWWEKFALWIVDLLLVVPSFFLIAVASRGAPEGDAAWIILAVLLAIFAWPLSARVVRSLTLSIREREYVLAAKFMGLVVVPDHRAAHPAERVLAADHRRHPRRRLRDPRRDRAVVLRVRRPAARHLAGHPDR